MDCSDDAFHPNYTPPSLACDIDACSRHDSNWLANISWDVVAIEPYKVLL